MEGCGQNAGKGGERTSLNLTYFPQYFPASTSEGKLNSVGYKVGKELKKVIKGILDYLKGLIPNANDVMRP